MIVVVVPPPPVHRAAPAAKPNGAPRRQIPWSVPVTAALPQRQASAIALSSMPPAHSLQSATLGTALAALHSDAAPRPPADTASQPTGDAQEGLGPPPPPPC